MEVPIWLERAFCDSARKAGEEINFAAFLEPSGPVVAGGGTSLVQVNQDGDGSWFTKAWVQAPRKSFLPKAEALRVSVAVR